MDASRPGNGKRTTPSSLDYPWDDFLVGPENALAHASVLALVRGDGDGISPLVVHGPSGAGKSRLLAGLVAEHRQRRPDLPDVHLTAETFAAACAEAANRPGGWLALRAQFRELALFVLEDLHALERAPLALAELAHTLDALDDAGAAVAVSARSGPGQWPGWPARLVNRLVGGLAVRVDPPGVATRRRYLLDRVRQRGLHLSAEAVEALAEAADGYRTLDGWLAQLTLSARVERRPIDRSLVEPLLTGDAAAPDVKIDQIAHGVASAFGVRLRDLRSSTRRQSVAEPRHVAIYLARALTALSFQAIGDYFGGRDPATVRHSCQTVASRIATDPALAATVAGLHERWRIQTGDPPQDA
jgi:chromosomal replication initiator protein